MTINPIRLEWRDFNRAAQGKPAQSSLPPTTEKETMTDWDFDTNTDNHGPWDYTPTTEYVRDAYLHWRALEDGGGGAARTRHAEAFDRWIATCATNETP